MISGNINRRKKINIVHSLQIKYTLSLLIPFFFIFVLVELQMFFIIKSLLPYIEFLAVKDIILKSIILVMVEVLLLLSIAGIINIIYLHRIGGPINRLIKEINEMVITKEYKLLQVRKKDELKPLIDAFNKIIVQLKEQQ